MRRGGLTDLKLGDVRQGTLEIYFDPPPSVWSLVVGVEVTAPWEFLPCRSHNAQQDREGKSRKREEEDDEAKEKSWRKEI